MGELCGAESFVEIVNGLKQLTVAGKTSVLDVLLVSENAPYELRRRDFRGVGTNSN